MFDVSLIHRVVDTGRRLSVVVMTSTFSQETGETETTPSKKNNCPVLL